MNTPAQVNLSSEQKLHNLWVALESVLERLDREKKPEARQAALTAFRYLTTAEELARQGR